MITVKRKIRFVRRPNHTRAIVDQTQPAAQVESGRVPRVSRLMALAIRFDRLVREGRVADLSELARLCQVTQPRMTQIMNLNHLAPDIQEQLLCLPKVINGRDRLYERTLRPVAATVDWQAQRVLWQALCASG